MFLKVQTAKKNILFQDDDCLSVGLSGFPTAIFDYTPLGRGQRLRNRRGTPHTQRSADRGYREATLPITGRPVCGLCVCYVCFLRSPRKPAVGGTTFPRSRRAPHCGSVSNADRKNDSKKAMGRIETRLLASLTRLSVYS